MFYLEKRNYFRKKIHLADIVLGVILTLFGLSILIPFINTVAISFTGYKEYLETPLLLFPKNPTLQSYEELISDGRIWIGYRTTILMLLIGLPLSMFLTSSTAYALSRKNYPGKKAFLMMILFTMIFQGGIVPLYLVMKDLNLTNTIWSVIFATSMNTFYMILMYNYFISMPESLIESARLDGGLCCRYRYLLSLPFACSIR